MTERDLSKRLGNLKNGTDDVKNHKFFRNINWEKLAQAKEPAIYIPQQSEKSTAANFHNIKDQYNFNYRNLPEYRDNVNFPPIKESRDPFLKWFWKFGMIV